MLIRQIFLAKPLAALAILVCLATIYALFKLNRRKPQNLSDRFLIGVLGVVAIYEALKLIGESGMLSLSVNGTFRDAFELIVAATCLLSAVLLRISRLDHSDAESAFRLARAAPPRSPGNLPATRELDILRWAVPRVSDGAFKLLAALTLNGSIPISQLGKSQDELDACLKELQQAGAVVVDRHGAIETVGLKSKAVSASR
jgi:hypothetical protein